jgi:hypothetical protein
MLQFRVFDSETARWLSGQFPDAGSVDIRPSGELFTAHPGEVILAPSLKTGEVLYIRVRDAANTPASPVKSGSDVEPAKHYVASGFLGLDGELEEDIPGPPKPWWKKLFVD